MMVIFGQILGSYFKLEFGFKHPLYTRITLAALSSCTLEELIRGLRMVPLLPTSTNVER